MSFTNRTSRAVLAAMFGKTTGQVFGAFGTPISGSIHVGLSTTTPNDDGTGVTEPGGGVGYARVAVASANWTDPTDANPSLIENSASVDFPTPSGAGWGTVTHFVIFDALTAGNVIAFGSLTTARAIAAGDPVSFPTGELEITLT